MIHQNFLIEISLYFLRKSTSKSETSLRLAHPVYRP